MSPLHRLPDGTWIILTKVSLINPLEACKVSGGLVPPHVVVGHDGTHLSLWFDDYSAAQSYADELAALVNAARSKQQ